MFRFILALAIVIIAVVVLGVIGAVVGTVVAGLLSVTVLFLGPIVGGFFGAALALELLDTALN